MAGNPFELLILKAGGAVVDTALVLGVDPADISKLRRGQAVRITDKVRQGLMALRMDVEAVEAEYQAYRAEKIERLREQVRLELSKGDEQ